MTDQIAPKVFLYINVLLFVDQELCVIVLKGEEVSDGSPQNQTCSQMYKHINCERFGYR